MSPGRNSSISRNAAMSHPARVAPWRSRLAPTPPH